MSPKHILPTVIGFTHRKRLASTAAAAVLALGGGTAFAQEQPPPDPAEFTPEGYQFCGWLNFTTKQWQMEWSDDLGGAFSISYARGMTCRDARRNVRRLRFPHSPPYSRPPTRPGYRCRYLKREYEYSDIRCTATSGEPRAFRMQAGA